MSCYNNKYLQVILFKGRMWNRIILSELYLFTGNSYFTAADYILLQAVEYTFFFFFFTVHEEKHKQHLQIEHADKTKRFELF